MFLTEPRRDIFLPLDALGAVPPGALDRLAALGVSTLDELRDLWSFGDRGALVDYLGESPARWFTHGAPALYGLRGATREGAPTPKDPLGPGGLVPTHYPRGALTRQPARPAPAPSPLPAMARRGAGAAMNLSHLFPPPRDQGERGTCVAFASVALLEYHLYAPGQAGGRHSEQFVYWACKGRDGIPDTEGTYVDVGRTVLAEAGACYDATWRYDPVRRPDNESQDPPPEGAVAEALSFLHTGVEALPSANDVADLRARLDAGRPVVVAVETFPAWDYPSVNLSGEVPMPLPGATRDGAHAVCLVGYREHAGLPGGGHFVFRNSWGGLWASEGRAEGGYGTLYFDYLRHHGLEGFA
jgi:hypothetical protein